ncbi:efflux RND transporter periplasmic adaptor subunit [Roseovarius dicentrarchi]|uniref:efflux RND transporter periplasmic adaptor subunit n=1 Tax=Roseovarius dicentrarchi TaxID=2250573 RepID=UPI000DE9CA4D|nr:efflux RND transporter periplasmic adaptor subunit [Roseovarius dicentrarchi]
MRRFVMLAISALILLAAYLVTFGVPAPIAGLVPAAEEGAPAPTAPGAAGRSARAPATSVVTAPLEFRPYTSVLNAIGTASALRSVDVVSNTAGTVTEANLAANRAVEAGEVLLRFDARTEAFNLEIAQANLDQARDTLSRYERLSASNNSTVTDVTLTDARVAVRLAEAAVGLAQVDLEDRTIRAPISGQLGLSDIGVGDVLANDSVIATIDQSETLVVEFELPERTIGLLAGAREVLASTPTFRGRVFRGEITSFDSRIDSITRSVTVKARIDNSDGILWPGMTFSVRLTQQSAPLPSLPATAITWSREGSGIYIDVDGTAQRLPVTLLFRRNDTVWIDAEIEAGTMVVTEGAQKLRSGARIALPVAGGDPA